MKTILLLLTITCGLLFPYGHPYTFIIRYLIMIMLFFSFLDVNFKKDSIKRSHFIIIAINIILPILLFFIVKYFNKNVADAVYITIAAPTAIAVPVVISLLKKNIEYSIISLVLTNFIVAAILPFTIPYLLKVSAELSIIDIMIPVATVFLIPFALAKIVRKISYEFSNKLSRYKDYTFYLLIINVYLASSKASNYISDEMTASISILFYIGIVIFIVCTLQFRIGYLIGEKKFNLEASQCLGQKNNGFTIWVALTFISPIAALGPVFYIVFQNVYISWQLYKYK